MKTPETQESHSICKKPFVKVLINPVFYSPCEKTSLLGLSYGAALVCTR